MTEFIIIGGGIVGLSVAYHLKNKGRSVRVLEKEQKISSHQSGRNSGVAHSGIYYKPGSEKAINCRRGKELLERFCVDNNVPMKKIGKLILSNGDHDRLHSLYLRGKDNGVDCKIIDRKEISRLEPNVKADLAIHVPETFILDYKEVCRKLSYKVMMTSTASHNLITCAKVIGIEPSVGGIKVSCDRLLEKTFFCKTLINCAGLHADRIARMAGHHTDVQIVPFKGEYYTLKEKVVNSLVYPMPDLRFPFLGVHVTPMIDGGIECGPNAVLAMGRESYSGFNLTDMTEMIKFKGLRKFMLKHWREGCHELLRSFSKGLYLSELKKLVPCIRRDDLIADRPPGIRAQAMRSDGNLVDDFLIERQENIIHILNTPSPAATACLAIGDTITKMVL